MCLFMISYDNYRTQKFQSNMELLSLHAQLNDELEKFNQYIHVSKEISISNLSNKELEQQQKQLMQSIRDINRRIQEKATIRARKK